MTTITAYIEGVPEERQERLFALYHMIQKQAPLAEEKFSYGMPTFYLNGNLVHFANMKHHIGFYPSPSAIQAFAEELTPYKTSKGAIQFPYSQELPLDLIARIVQFRVAENSSSGK